MEIRVRRSGRVPLREQIATQLSGAIREGAYPAGRRLPSVRALAGRLGVHRNTVRAAYGELARRGLVGIRRGSGVYVAGRAGEPAGRPPPSGDGCRDAFRNFLAAGRTSGRDADDLWALFRRWRASVAAGRLLVVAAERALAEVLAHELRARTGLDSRAVTPAELRDAAGPDLPPGLLVAPFGLTDGLRERLPPWREIFPIHLAPSRPRRSLVRRVPAGSLIAVVSRSRLVRRRERALAAGLRGEEIGLATLGPEPTPRLRRVLRVASFVLADLSCAPELAGRVDVGRLVPMRLASSRSLRELSAYLGIGEDREDPRRASAGAG